MHFEFIRFREREEEAELETHVPHWGKGSEGGKNVKSVGQRSNLFIRVISHCRNFSFMFECDLKVNNSLFQNTK